MRKLREIEEIVFDRVNPAVRFSVTRYVFSIGIFAAIGLFGLISARSLGVDLLPSVAVPSVSSSVSLPGASPVVVDQQVTQVLENAVSTLEGVVEISSQSSTGSGRVSVTFDAGVDRDAALNQVAQAVNAATRRLPSQAAAPVTRGFDANAAPVFQFGLSGGGAGLAAVAGYVEGILGPLLERVEGVANVQADGAPSRQFQVLLDPNRLRLANLSPQQVVSAVTSSAVNQPIGTIQSRGSSLSFSTRNVPEGLEELRRVLVDPARGIALGDLGAVRDVTVNSGIARVDGEPVVLVSVQRSAGSNAVAVVDGVRDLLDRTRLPEGWRFLPSNDTTGPIRASVESTWRELGVSALVVAFIILLFLGKARTAFSVVLAIPIALSASPILYRLAGFSFNLVSLLALVTAIGIVVDDSIVVAENVERYRAMGFDRREAVLRGGSEVFSAVVASTLSLLAVLVPVSFIGGFIGRYLMQFALGLSAAVAFSLVEALLFLTVRMAYMAEDRKVAPADLGAALAAFPSIPRSGLLLARKPLFLAVLAGGALALVLGGHAAWLPLLLPWPLVLGFLGWLLACLALAVELASALLGAAADRVILRVREAYAASLAFVLPASAWILGGTFAVMAGAALLLVPGIPFSFVPQSDSGYAQVNLRLPQGSQQTRVNEAAAVAENYLFGRPEVRRVQTTVGGGAELVIELAPKGERAPVALLAQDYRRDLQAALRGYPSLRVSVGAGGGGFGFGGSSSMQLSLAAADLGLLRSRDPEIIGAIQADPWVADVSSSLADVAIESRFIPDASRLRGTGISPQSIATTLQTYASGAQAGSVVSGGLAYPIRVLVDPTLFSGAESLLDLPVYSSALQASLPVSQLGRFELAETPSSISRYNRRYAATYNVNLKPGAPTGLEMQARLNEALAAAGILDGGVETTPGNRFGQAALAAELQASGPWIFLLAFFLSYLVMAAQFNSWRFPLYLLLPVPLALVGALVTVWVAGGGLDIFGVMGMIMLIGLSSKSAILYLEFVVERLRTMELAEALVDAARLRFRPILMTTLTTVVIAFPLILSGGQGSEFGQRMGIVMFGGILVSTALTFYVVPAAFWTFERGRALPATEGPPGESPLPGAGK